jgi:hypothetical protein
VGSTGLSYRHDGGRAFSLPAMEVKLGKPTLEHVGESATAMAWSGLQPTPGNSTAGEDKEEWIAIGVAVELDPWPDRDWLTFWQEEDLDWPDRFEEPMLDGRKLMFEASEEELQAAWDAVKARVAATNRASREHHSLDEGDKPDVAEQESLARLRELAQRRIDALE